MSYYNHHAGYQSREQWLDSVARGHFRPKPPESWLADQEIKGRSRKTASIIWGTAYKPDRKFVIWDQAPIEDYKFLGYYIDD